MINLGKERTHERQIKRYRYAGGYAKILKQGWYEKNGKRIQLKLSAKEMQEIQVYLPEAVKKNCSDPEFSRPFVIGRCGHGCENIDSFALARKRLGDTYLFTRDDRALCRNYKRCEW